MSRGGHAVVTRWSRGGHAGVTRAGGAVQEHVRVVLLVLEGAAPLGSSAPAPEAAARPGRLRARGAARGPPAAARTNGAAGFPPPPPPPLVLSGHAASLTPY